MANTKVKYNRKFKPLSHYSTDSVGYYLLPFRFKRLENDNELLVNDWGDFIIVENGFVEKLVKRELFFLPDDERYQDLLANFFISDTPVPNLLEVIAARYRTKKSFLDTFTSLHIFVISLRCDHTCHYCQVSRVSEDKHLYDMSEDHILKGIEIMMRSPAKHITMEFQGGESLLAFDKIKYAITKAQERAEELNKQMTYVICSNLAPLTDEILHYCKENRVLLSTSLDGPAFVHNKNRYRPGRNSYELAINGLKRAQQELGEDAVSALLTTTNLSLKYPIEIVDEYIKHGFKSIFLRPISPFGFATKNSAKNFYETEEFLEFYKKALHHIIEYNLKGNFFREDYATILLRKILTPFPVGYVDLQSPAGMINNVIVFNYDGDIYASDESRMLAEMGDFTFKIGSLDTHDYNDIFYGSKAREFMDSMLNESMPGCSDCVYQPYCGADPVLHYATQKDMIGHKPSSVFCKKNMSILDHIFQLMEDPRIERIFRNWITGSHS